MRVGQNNGLVYQWTKKGPRPRQPKDQRYENAYLFGAVCPGCGSGARAHHAARRQQGDAEASRGDRPRGGISCLSPCHPRPGRLAHDGQTQGPGQHHPGAAAASLSPTQCPGKHLAVSAPDLSLKPRICPLCRHPRCVPQRLAQAPPRNRPHRIHCNPAVGHHRLIPMKAGINCTGGRKIQAVRVNPTTPS